MAYDLDNPVFKEEDAAREWLEASRWPNGPICPHCRIQEGVKPTRRQEHGQGLVSLSALPREIHRPRWDAVRAFVYPAAPMVARHAPAYPALDFFLGVGVRIHAPSDPPSHTLVTRRSLHLLRRDRHSL